MRGKVHHAVAINRSSKSISKIVISQGASRMSVWNPDPQKTLVNTVDTRKREEVQDLSKFKMNRIKRSRVYNNVDTTGEGEAL